MHGVTGSGKTEVYLRLADAVRRSGPRRADAGAGDRADATGGGAVSRAVWPGRGDSAQRLVRRRAPRSVASHPPRRRRRGDRHALGGVCAAGESRIDHRRRGARHLLQAGRDAALSRPRCGDHARQVRRRAGGDRFRDADDRVVRECDRGQVHAGHDEQARPRPAAGERQRGQHARRDRRSGRGRGVEPAVAGGDRGSPRARRAVVDPVESPRLCDGRGLSSVHGGARVPELQYQPHHPQPVRRLVPGAPGAKGEART